MKRTFIKFTLFVASIFALTNCVKEESFVPVQEEVEAGVPFQVVADITADTKTYNDGMKTMWANGDRIKVSFTMVNGEVMEITNPLVTTGDGNFTGQVDWTNVVGGINAFLKVSDFTVTYPFAVGESNIVPKSTVQNGYNSTAHLAGPNCPLTGTVSLKDFDYSIFNLSEVSLPKVMLNHVASVAEVIVTNNSDEPLVINSVSVGESTGDLTSDVATVVREVKGTTVVENATELAVGETAKVYVIVEPFTVSPSEEGTKLVFWVNDTPKEVSVERDITFTAGKMKKVNFSYKGEQPELYAVADVRKEMVVERIVPSINTLVDLEYVKQWVLYLKNNEDISGVLTDAAVSLVAGDIDAVYYALNGIPGFEHQTEVVVGTGKHIRRVSFQATDYLASYLEQINNIDSIDDILAILAEVESYYEVLGFKDQVSTGMGTVLDYMTEIRKSIESYFQAMMEALGIVTKPVKPSGNILTNAAEWAKYYAELATYETSYGIYEKAVETFEGYLKGLTNLSLVDLVEAALENEYAEMVLNWMFDNNNIRQGLIDYIVKAIEGLEFDIDADNEMLKEYAMQQALMYANIEASNNVDANFEQLNQNEVDQLNKGPWGLFKKVLEMEEVYGFFQEYELTDVYNVLQTISKTVEGIVVYDQVKVEIVNQTCDVYAPSEIPQN